MEELMAIVVDMACLRRDMHLLISTIFSKFVFVCICGGLSRFGPHRLMGLNAWSLRKGTIRRYVLVRGSDMCHWGYALEFQKFKPGTMSLSFCCRWRICRF